MHSNSVGIPPLRIVTHRCPNLVDQLTRVKKPVANKDVLDDRKARGVPTDTVDALEYFAATGPRYINVPKPKPEESESYRRDMEKFGKKNGNEKVVQVGTFY
jgi:hypothetical protein